MKFQNPKDRVLSLIKAGWSVQTEAHKSLPAKVQSLGFKSLYFLSNGEEIIGIFA